MLYRIGEWHRVKCEIGKVIQKGEWVLITEREKKGKDTYVTIQDRNGESYPNISVKKLYRRAAFGIW